MTARLRVGVIGLGTMGRHHARVLTTLEGVEIVGVVDPGGERVATPAGVPLLDCVDRLIAQGLDLCVVAAPTAEHESIGLQLADAGVHALVEKPLADSVQAAERIAKAFDRRGLLGCVGHVERYNPALQQMRGQLEAGEIGDVFQVATRRQGPFPHRVRDVGVVKDLATHDVDLTAWVTRQRYRSVAAHTAHRSGRDYEDLVAVVAQLGSDAVVSHLVNWLSPMKERVTIVTGEYGCLVADTLTADLTRYTNAVVPMQWDTLSSFRGVSEGDMIRYAIPKPEPLATELAAFRDAVRGEPADVVTMQEGTYALVVAEAILHSAALRAMVQVGP